LCGYTVDPIPATADGRVDLDALQAKLGPDVAAIMLTNPNTCGLFERDIRKVADMVHAAGAFFYCDGANFNAIVGKVRPGDLGIDAMHINLHKTFSTPHGGGGPGSGPVVLSEALKDFVPVPYVVHGADGFKLVEAGDAKSFGRMKAFHGQMGMFIRALAYMMSHGADGLKRVAEDSVLSANYVMASLKDVMTPSFEGPCMHEALFDDRFLKDTGVTTLDFAKAMIDEGYHPMTVYFPLVVHGAMLIEPTESESKDSVDTFVGTLRGLAEKAKQGDQADWFRGAPYMTPRRRLDETRAARAPVLRWKPGTNGAPADKAAAE
jgi:glycine dehydrogenase subunit 2